MSPVQAFEAFVIKDIKVEGAQITEAGTVFNYMPINVGDTMNDERAILSIQSLYATGFYQDVKLSKDGDTLIVKVVERPVIDSVTVTGTHEFSSELIVTGLKEIGLGASRIFDRALMEASVQDIKRQYLDRGFYSTIVDSKVQDLERNRVAITFTVSEGEVARIHRINIIGNQKYSEGDLTDIFQLSTPDWLTWLTHNDKYSRDKLSADLETLRSWYQDRGYLEFNIDDTNVSLSPDLKEVYVSLSIIEGEKYTVDKVYLEGKLLLPDDILRKSVSLKPGDAFSRRKLNETLKAIRDRLGNEGYAFPRVEAQPTPDKAKKTVSFRIYVEPGQKSYVRRVEIVGNYVTKDEVIRRRVLQLESAVYDAGLIARSRDAIDRSGFFESVLVDTKPVPGSPDQVDVEFKVKERLSGSIQLGVGYGSGGQLSANVTIKYDNFLGSGDYLAVAATKYSDGQEYSLSQTFPYITINGIDYNYTLYKRDYNFSDYRDYEQKSYGAGTGISVPVAEEDRIYVGFNGEVLRLRVNDTGPLVYKNFISIFGNDVSYVTLNLGWSRDRRDSLFYPRQGVYQNLGLEYTMPVTQLRFARLNYQYQQYFPVFLRDAILFNTNFGMGTGIRGKPLPFFKNYSAGGPDTLRGFDYNGIGPLDGDGYHTGGDRRWLSNVEYLFPFPGSGQDRTLRMSFFLDAGQVWNKGQHIGLNDLSSSYGISLNWASPLGPFRISYAFPMKTQSGNQTQQFQFSFGTLFQ